MPSASQAGRVAVPGRLQDDRVQAAVEAQEPERGRRGLARALAVGAQPHAAGAQRSEQRGRRRVAAQVHAGVVVVEAAELEAPRADVVPGPDLERGDGGLASGDGRDVELADGGEAARQMLERGRPDRVAAGCDRALCEHDGAGHAIRSRSRVRVATMTASAMPMPSIATSRGVAVRPGTKD